MLGNLVEKAFIIAGKVPKPLQEPSVIQEATLKKLLDFAQHTAFGRFHGFTRILNSKDLVSAFRDQVPIVDYNQIYDQWWHRLLDSEADVCWPGKVKYFALSSGTSGSPSKYIPVTRDMQKSMRRAGLRLFMSLPKFGIEPGLYSKQMLMIGSSSTLTKVRDYQIGDLSGINSQSPPFWIRGYYKPGTEISKTRDWNERTAIIVENAPKWDIGYLTGIPSWVLMTLQAIVEHYKLESIHDLWPNLEVFVSGGINFVPYNNAFQQIFSKKVQIIDSYLASEGFIAFQNRPCDLHMQLCMDNGLFFEFIPYTEDNYTEDGHLKSGVKSLLINEIEEDVDYSLVLSSNSGAWRYQIGDLVRFKDRQRKEIIISGRTSHYLSVTGEHLSVANMTAGIVHVQDELGITIKEFTVAPVASGKFFAHRWFLGTDAKVDTHTIAALLDQKLFELNDDYATERKALALDEIQIRIIPNDWFYEFMATKGKLNGQAKFPRVLRNEQLADWQEFIKQKDQTAMIILD